MLCPTRELADQVAVEIRRLARASENIKVVTLCGGIALRGQRASLENGAHIVVGTPGRIMDHLERGYLTLEGLNTLVLDEADRMLDMGFVHDMRYLMSLMPENRQTLFFSATMAGEIAKLTHQFLKNPVSISVKTRETSKNIEQDVVNVRGGNKIDTARVASVPV